MENNNNPYDVNADDFAFSSFSDEIPPETMQKLQTTLHGVDNETKKYAANVLIGHYPALKVSDHIGVDFTLRGIHIKPFTFRSNGKKGNYIVLFGQKDGVPCSYYSTSEKVYEAITALFAVYGNASEWGDGIPVRIRMNAKDDVKAYSLEVV